MTTPAERDAAVERLLRAMRADATPGAPDVCLDADVLARWADGALSSEEADAVTAHAADCARCQMLLAAMARTEPPREVPPRGRFGWTFVRWGLPLSAAAALALWIAVDRSPSAPQRTVSNEQAAANISAQARTPPKDAPETEARPAASPADAYGAVPPERDEPTARRDRRASADAAAANAPAAAPAPTLKDAQAIAGAPFPTVPAPTPPAAAAPVAPPPVIAREAAKEFQPPAQAAGQQIPGGALAETVVTESARETRALESRRQPAASPWVEVPSPDPLVRWRFTFRGDVERSNDAGLTWTREPLAGARADLLSGVGPTSALWWLAGRGGGVLRFTSADGWQRVSLPDRAHIVSITASDAQNATVRLAGGRTLSTTDGGKAWR